MVSYSSVYQQLVELLANDNEKLFEINRHGIATKDYELYMSLLNNFLAAAEDYSLGGEANEFVYEDNLRDARSSISSRSKDQPRGSRRSSSFKDDANEFVYEDNLRDARSSISSRSKDQPRGSRRSSSSKDDANEFVYEDNLRDARSSISSRSKAQSRDSRGSREDHRKTKQS